MAHTQSPVRRVQDYEPAPLDDPTAYPGQWPAGPVVLEGDRVIPVPATAATAGRAPMLAIGSNACPAQLRRKGLRGPILLLPTVLRNHLVVYAGHVTTYGSVPATLVRWPDARAMVFSIWLNPRQRAQLDASEGGNYEPVTVHTSAGQMPAYRAHTGVLRTLDDRPVPLASIIADAPAMPRALAQDEALQLLLAQRR